VSRLPRRTAFGPLALLAALGLASAWPAGCAGPSAVRLDPAPDVPRGRADERSAQLVDELLEALGGRAAWEALRCIEWTFAGRRHHVWDKWTGDVRVDQGPRTVLMNLETRQGRVFEGGVELALAPAALAEALETARRAWINDSYWLCAPYKLRDPGVVLRWRGATLLPDGRTAQIVTMTFEGVGVTPDNGYELWISDDRKLLEQWAYLKHRDDPAPSMTTPWTDFERHGGVLFATQHGSGPSTDSIRVHVDPPASLFAP